jgi:hypothetical protein
MKVSTILAGLLFIILATMSFIGLIHAVIIQPESKLLNLSMVGDILWGLLPIEFALLATMIIARNPRNSIGWLLMLPAVALSSSGFLATYFGGITGLVSDPSWPIILGYWFYSSSWLLLIFPVFLIMLLFPTGRPINPNWRWTIYYVVGVFIYFLFVITLSQSIEAQNGSLSIPNPVGIIPAHWFDQFLWLTFAFGLASITIVSVISIFVRYQRALAVEREQIKWLLFASGLFAAAYFIAIGLNLSSDTWGTSGTLNLILPLALMAMPVAIAIAILRYRLWDIEVIIRKTLVYGILTATLAVVFFGGVTLLQSFFQAISGEESPISLVLSTMAIAALFNPLHKRIQRGIDQRFFRRKYDAQKILMCFSASMRDEVELEEVSKDLLAVVDETLQPVQVSIWLKMHK